MPALITHRLFGEESIDLLPEHIITSEDERAAFLIANQGPDPFFFRFRTSHMHTSRELASAMHRCRMSRQFAAIRDGVGHLQPIDAGVGRAWALGLLSHYVLDRCAHPFVYAQQWGIQALDEDLAGAGGQVHALIESDLDVLMLQIKRRGATVADCPPAKELITNARIDKVAGALVGFVANSVYHTAIGADEYGKAVADMQLIYRMIEPAETPRSHAIARIEGLFKDYSLLQALAHRVTVEPPAATGNLAHRIWTDPFTDEARTDSFPALFERALEDYGKTAALFIEGGDMAAVTGRLNYSGRPLGPDEEFDGDE